MESTSAILISVCDQLEDFHAMMKINAGTDRNSEKINVLLMVRFIL
jgi:hypothetical protein